MAASDLAKLIVFEATGSRAGTLDEVPTLLAREGALFWLDLQGPTTEHTELMANVLGFHPLAIEDTRNQKQRPKVDEYDDHLFLILNPVSLVDEEPVFRELDVFLGQRFLVTVHPAPEPVLQEAARRFAKRDGKPTSTGYLLYALVDTVVDTYFPMLDHLDDELSDLEDLILESSDSGSLDRLLALKRTLLDVRRVVAPQRDMFNVLTRRDLPYIDHEVLGYHLRDVYDHLLRITDMVDTFRDLLSSSVDLYMSALSNRLNQVVNRLTRVTVVIGAMAVITGFYGMNLTHTWPAFEATWAVPFVLALMAAVAFLLFRHFGKEE
jgi:magnesium transporter